jgi:hypothetical protein
MKKTLKIQILSLGLLLLIVGCDKNKVKQDTEKAQSILAEQQRERNIRQKLIEQQEQAAETRSNLEFQAFQRANILFNAHEYALASSAYHDFIRDFTLSARVPIVQQRLKDVDRVLANQKATALAQAQAKQAAKAAAVAQAQEDARLRAQYQVQAPTQKNSAFSLTDTAKGTGQSRGDAYAAARQKLPAGAEEISTVYDWYGDPKKTFICKITYRR